MATTTTKPANVRQKLIKARKMFLDRNVRKSGKNMQLEFKYFELADIVPSAIEIFDELGLLTTVSFTGELAVMTVYNADNLDELGIDFVVPYREMEQIRNKAGVAVTNPLQALGSSITYMRRYLYMTVLDIVEQDEIEATLTSNPGQETEKETPAPKVSKKPATTTERKEIKQELTKEEAQASAKEVTKIKSLCKKLIELDPSKEEFVQKIALKTDGFKQLTKSSYEKLLANMEMMIAEYEKGSDSV